MRLPPDDDPRRAEVREWLRAHPSPSGAELATAGYVAPHWPKPWGFDADPVTQLVIDDELTRAGVAMPDNPIGIGWAGPTLLAGGTEAQQARWLPGVLSGTEFWCQLFSEPGSGSDLASLATRAVRDGDHYVVSGQKVWNTWAERADYGILLARTDPDAPKHKGISYFVCPMRSSGITARPIREMTGGHHFCEVFLDEVRIPVDHRIGAEGEGWRLATVTLANERVSLSTGGVCWGAGPTSGDFFNRVRARGGVADPLLRQRAARVYTDAFILDLLGDRLLEAMVSGRTPGPEASIKKLLADEHGQRLTLLERDLLGPAAMLDDRDDGEWAWAFLFSRALTVGGGTGEVQRSIIGERLLGLPREPIAR